MSHDPIIVPAREAYDRWADSYQGKGNASVTLKNDEVRRLTGPVKELDVIDLGCGAGRHAIRFAQAGAKVTAVDFSARMLQQARRRPGAGGIRFVEWDLNQALPFDADSFDRVVCSCALEHVENLDGALAEMARICRPAGWVVLVEMHPALRRQDVAAKFEDPESGREIRPHSCQYQVSQYVMAAVRAGLSIEEIREPSDPAGEFPWPLLLTMKLRGQPGEAARLVVA